jgi:hypothetical protein
MMGLWDLWVRVLEKNSIDQEHEVLFRVCEIDVVFEILSKMDVWEITLFWETREIFCMCSWGFLLWKLFWILVLFGNGKLLSCGLEKCVVFCFKNDVDN